MGLIAQKTVQQIRDRVSIVDVARQLLPSMRRKGRSWWACCPFHNEKSASFHIVEQGNYYHCFGCGAHGTAVDLVMEMRGCTFVDAIEYLAPIAGIAVEKERDTRTPAQKQKQQDGYDALEAASRFFQKNLDGAALSYLQKRGLSADTIQTFRLGWVAEEWRSLKEVLTAQNISDKTMLEAGLVTVSEKGGEPYDRFRGRVMFPIENSQNRVIGFGGRVMDSEAQGPKYLNSSETEFFNKRRVLYNLNRAQLNFREEQRAIVVEGYMDVIGLWQQGVRSAVAPLGTALTEEQVQLLWRYHDSPIVCLDGDEAGRRAALRSAEMILPHLEPGKTLRFATLPDGEDPDSIVRSKGKTAFEEVLNQAVSLEDVLWQALEDGHALGEADGRAQAESRMGELVGQIKNDIVRKHYQMALRDRLWKRVRGNISLPAQTARQLRSALTDTDTLLCAVLFREPHLLEKFSDEIASLTFKDGTLNAFLRHAFHFLGAGTLDKAAWRTYLRSAGMYERYQRQFASDILDAMSQNALAEYWLKLYRDRHGKFIMVQQQKQAIEALKADPSGDAWAKARTLFSSMKQRQPETEE